MESEAKAGSSRKASARACRRRGAGAHERDTERAGAWVKYFDLSGGRLASLSRREQNHRRGPLLADSARRLGAARAAQAAIKPRAAMPTMFVVLGGL